MDGTSSGAVSARLALGVTTVALVTLASAGTAVVVRTGASAVDVGSLPPQVGIPLGVGGSGAIIVGAPPGRAWPGKTPAIRRFVGTPSTAVSLAPNVTIRIASAGPRAVLTSFIDRAKPPPITPLIATAPAAAPPAENAPIQPHLVVQQPAPVSPAGPAPAPPPAIAPPAPATASAPAPTPARPASIPAVGPTVPTAPTATAALAGHGQPSVPGDQPRQPAEQPTGQPTSHPVAAVPVKQPARETPARVEGASPHGNRPSSGRHRVDSGDDGHAARAGGQQPDSQVGSPDDKPDEQQRARDHERGDRHGSGGDGLLRANNRADRHGHGGDGQLRANSRADRHGHGNRPS